MVHIGKIQLFSCAPIACRGPGRCCCLVCARLGRQVYSLARLESAGSGWLGTALRDSSLEVPLSCSRHCFGWCLAVRRHPRVTRTLIDRSAWLVEPFCSFPCMCSPAASTSRAASTGTAHDFPSRGLAQGLPHLELRAQLTS